MKRPLPPSRTSRGARAVAAFAGTVVLALLAAASVTTPDVAVQSADSLTLLPAGLEQILPDASTR